MATLTRESRADQLNRAIGPRSEQTKEDKDLAFQIGVEFPLAAAKTFSMRTALTMGEGQTFRFLFISDKKIDWSPKKAFLFLGDRKSKGEAEKGLLEIAESQKPTFETYILRPNAFLPPGTAPSKKGVGMDPAQLGKAMVKLALEGNKNRIIENDALLKM